MTDREIKQILKNAYSMPESDRAHIFIKKHEKRSRQFVDVIKNEFSYMGLRSLLAGMLLCIVFVVIAINGDESTMWAVSAMIPVCSVVPMNFILRSERYGMIELEAASRFSIKFIRLIRMCILGIFSSVVILGGCIFLRKLCLHGMLDIVIYMLLPYFVSIWGSLFVARKWHGKESSIGVPIVCLATGFLPVIISGLRQINFVSDYMYVMLTVIIGVAIIKECIGYINERSDLSWNLC